MLSLINHFNIFYSGSEAREGEIPWHVSMLRSYEGWHGCSAALLSCDPAIILTAAHCVEWDSEHRWPVLMLLWFVARKTKASELKLGFGSHVLDVYRPSPLAENEQRLEVGEIIPHPRYSRYLNILLSTRQSWLSPFFSIVTRFGKCKGQSCERRKFLFNSLNVSIFENDIAILKLKNPEMLRCEERKVWPACLPNAVCCLKLLSKLNCQFICTKLATYLLSFSCQTWSGDWSAVHSNLRPVSFVHLAFNRISVTGAGGGQSCLAGAAWRRAETGPGHSRGHGSPSWVTRSVPGMWVKYRERVRVALVPEPDLNMRARLWYQNLTKIHCYFLRILSYSGSLTVWQICPTSHSRYTGVNFAPGKLRSPRRGHVRW